LTTVRPRPYLAREKIRTRGRSVGAEKSLGDRTRELARRTMRAELLKKAKAAEAARKKAKGKK
jgi:hypothetical protein